ncbi:hypothetical protein MOQ72_20420 [Saccharopolyspora sp. K220]|uniref:hypothetical protein n=1 Tax=Saccharopolyspora soli TaxID=2926618 RepID=UPI001F59F944|nr:hypothetical protein [Saccharopolyspora soli]MCI2419814.1 hypothetical protein [Saccharopolyspora soli]
MEYGGQFHVKCDLRVIERIVQGIAPIGLGRRRIPRFAEGETTDGDPLLPFSPLEIHHANRPWTWASAAHPNIIHNPTGVHGVGEIAIVGCGRRCGQRRLQRHRETCSRPPVAIEKPTE